MRQPVVSAALFNWIETDECKSYIEIQDIKKTKKCISDLQICEKSCNFAGRFDNKVCRKKKNNMDSEPSSVKRSCTCSTISDCPYNIPKECKFDKDRCLHEKKKGHAFYLDPSKCRLAIWGLVALSLYIVIKLYENHIETFPYGRSLCVIFSTIFITIVAGVILTFVIDLPTRLKDYEKSFVHALSSNAYLKTLDEQKLTKLRNDVTEQLHKVNAPSMAKGLIEMDQKICELLRLPYYTRYRQVVVCEKPDEYDYIVKEHAIEYKLVNPYGVNKEGKEILQMTNLVKLNNQKDTEKERDEVLKLLEFSCVIDDVETRDIKEECEICYKPLEKKDEYYDTKVTLKAKRPQNMSAEMLSLGVPVSFKDNIQVRIRYTIKVHKEDRCFSKRLQHPVHNFRLDYSSKSDNVKLYGQIFGTEMKQSDMSIISASDNSISLECFDWLLPQNGAIVVML